VSFYSDAVQNAIGVENIAGSLAQQRASLAVLHPRIVSVTQTPYGVELTVRATSKGSSVGIQSFLLRRGKDGWRVVYDTLLGDALPGYVENATQHRLAPGSTTPVPEAQVAGERIASLYRTLAVKKAAKPQGRIHRGSR
jgi:hypothetical protein